MIISSFMLKFQNSFSKLPSILFENVLPTPLKEPILMAFSDRCAQDIDWKSFGLDSEKTTRWLNGSERLPGDQRIATRYAGHQFGVWAGQLGDGRAISLGEYLDSRGQRWEIQTKGSGLTPFSRMGDGKAVIRSSVREFLCSEAMHALKIPTTRALALINGNDSVRRERMERSALMARVFPSNLRFGHFEYCFHFQEKEALRELIRYSRETFFPETKSTAEMLAEVSARTANLLAHWMSVGFCHGVMNTDNMSFLGITIDYGPFGFLEDTNLAHICNHSDPQGRYSFQNQPEIALWNLDRLFQCFIDFVPVEELRRILSNFQQCYEATWLDLFRAKLGLEATHSGDRGLIESLLIQMHEDRLDFTHFFRSLSAGKEDPFYLSNGSISAGMRDWALQYFERLDLEEKPATLRKQDLIKVNPKFILRNYIAQMIIDEVEHDENRALNDWLKILENPFDEHPKFEKFALPTPSDKKDCEVSCSS